jgi:hypothetical protein
MSEDLPHSSEPTQHDYMVHARVSTVEQVSLTAAESEQKNTKRHHESPKEAENDPLLHSLEAIKTRVEQESQSSENYDRLDLDNDQNSSHTLVMHRELKDDAYRRTLQKVRGHLSAPDRAFSKLIHQPTVEMISTVAANTVGRPSGLFMGGLFALAANSFLLFMARKYGFAYSYTVMILGFMGGFALGIVLELIWRLLRRHK